MVIRKPAPLQPLAKLGIWFGAVSAICAVIGLVWKFGPPTSNTVSVVQSPNAIGINNGTLIGTQNNFSSRETEEKIDPGIFVECALTLVKQIKTPPDGLINVLSVHPGIADGLIVMGAAPGSDYPISRAQTGAMRCAVTNYDLLPRIKVGFSIHFVFKEAVADGNSIRSGAIALEQNAQVLIGKIDAGPAAVFTFDVQNPSKYFVQMFLPETATVQHIGEDAPRTVKVASVGHIPHLIPAVAEEPEPSGK
jgi:hypothetical protein